MNAQPETLNELILSTQPVFQELDLANGRLLDFKQECMFARQQITKNSYTQGIAGKNPVSLKSAICNVAAIGISLNPALAHAYLVPRGGAICLDVSYRGLVKLATDAGAILWAKTELVYANDTYEWNGINNEPVHKAEPFGERGEVIGGYCLAKLPDGSVMVENMARAEMDKIQATSMAKDGPWKTWPDQMRIKCVTKRASKSWPQTENRERIDRAIEVLNSHEGSAPIETADVLYTSEQADEYQKCVEEADYFNLAGLITSLDSESQLQLNSLYAPVGEQGTKMAVRKAFGDNLKEGRMNLESAINNIREFLDDGNDADIAEILSESSQWTIEHIMSNVSIEHRAALNRIGT